MTSDEYIIPLVVKSDHLPAPELWLPRKQAREHLADRMAQVSCEVIEDHFRLVRGGPAMMLIII